MNKWELARYILDAKKSVDSVLYLCSHAEELSMIDLRSEVNEIKRKFYVNGCIVLDKCFPKNKKDICTATERIINRIEIANNYKKYGSIEGGGYIWHTTGSGKTLTSFKTDKCLYE